MLCGKYNDSHRGIVCISSVAYDVMWLTTVWPTARKKTQNTTYIDRLNKNIFAHYESNSLCKNTWLTAAATASTFPLTKYLVVLYCSIFRYYFHITLTFHSLLFCVTLSCLYNFQRFNEDLYFSATNLKMWFFHITDTFLKRKI